MIYEQQLSLTPVGLAALILLGVACVQPPRAEVGVSRGVTAHVCVVEGLESVCSG